MPSSKNITAVEDLVTKFEKAEVAVFVDYCGLNAEETDELRAAARKAGIELRVKKNRLIKIALEKAGCEIPGDALKNPTMVAFGYEDPVTAPKLITSQIKVNEKIILKGGVYEKKAIDDAEIKTLASLPTKDELLGRLAGSLSPQNLLGRLLRSVKNPVTKLTYGLNALKEQKS